MPTITLSIGDDIIIQLADTDGQIVINYDETHGLIVHADLPDTSSRAGTIYHEPLSSNPLEVGPDFDPVGPGTVAWNTADLAVEFLAKTKIALAQAGKAEHDFAAWVETMMGQVDSKVREVWADQHIADPAPEMLAPILSAES